MKRKLKVIYAAKDPWIQQLADNEDEALKNNATYWLHYFPYLNPVCKAQILHWYQHHGIPFEPNTTKTPSTSS